MTPLDLLTLSLALLAVFIAVFIKRPVVNPSEYIKRADIIKPLRRYIYYCELEIRLLQSQIYCLQRDTRKKQKRDSKGRFA